MQQLRFVELRRSTRARITITKSLATPSGEDASPMYRLLGNTVVCKATLAFKPKLRATEHENANFVQVTRRDLQLCRTTETFHHNLVCQRMGRFMGEYSYVFNKSKTSLLRLRNDFLMVQN